MGQPVGGFREHPAMVAEKYRARASGGAVTASDTYATTAATG